LFNRFVTSVAAWKREPITGEGGKNMSVPTFDEKFWREHHQSQAEGEEKAKFDQYAPAYRTAHEAATKYSGKSFDQIEDDVALDYEKHRAGSALPWDRARPSVRAAWTRISGVVAPRDPDRGTRSGF
jgi:hypothetical protein